MPALNAADDLGTIGVIDETSVAKKGTKTPGVHRQYCGSLGKIENCIVTVHLAVVRGLFKTLIDAALFLPKAWSENRERCREAKIPDDVVYQPKWRLALDQIARAFANGLKFDWLTFDEYYGSKPAFLEELDARSGTYYVGEIPRNFRCLTKRPRGEKPKKGWKGKRADNLARYSSVWYQQNWQNVSSDIGGIGAVRNQQPFVGPEPQSGAPGALARRARPRRRPAPNAMPQETRTASLPRKNEARGRCCFR